MNSKKYSLIMVLFILSVFVMNSCKKDMYQGVTEPEVYHLSKLFVNSDPKPLKIYLDGNYLGVDTPDTVNWLPDGDHILTLTNDLYPDTSFSVSLENNELKTFYVNGFNNPKFYNKIYIESIPSKANIIFNDSVTGNVTPYYWNRLLPANYKIKLELPMHRSDSVEVYLKKGVFRNFNVRLEDTTHYVTYKTSNSGIISNYITSIAVDSKNVKWIGTLDKGIFTFDGNNWNKITFNDVFYAEQINKLIFDKSNRMWVICSSGLLLYENAIWRNMNSQFGTDLINDISIANDGTVNVSTRNGFFQFKNEKWNAVNTGNSCTPTDVINTSLVSNSGELWLGTLSYTVSFKNNNCLAFRLDLDDPISPNISIIFEDYSNRIVFLHHALSMTGTRDALTAFDGSDWIEISIPYVSPSQLRSVYREDNGNMWFCTDGGFVLQRTDGSILNINRTDSSIPIKMCTSFVKDINGDYWVGTSGSGLIKIKQGTIQ